MDEAIFFRILNLKNGLGPLPAFSRQIQPDSGRWWRTGVPTGPLRLWRLSVFAVAMAGGGDFSASRGFSYAVGSELCLGSGLGPAGVSLQAHAWVQPISSVGIGGLHRLGLPWSRMGRGGGHRCVCGVPCGEQPEFFQRQLLLEGSVVFERLLVSRLRSGISCYVFGAAALGPGVAGLLAARGLF
ncbi:potassium channel in Arabidopsis thaliana 3 [Striga asiatica]|uniref:Potassium channel in Arabidopsis thaliana 3 n=1 Tax=Striga asiatica TaxID=4170 RepID=A0A5A7RFX3_STRAF|nr:potassium channel in Arabidopsis thaliana 3 [Striga asiatica]